MNEAKARFCAALEKAFVVTLQDEGGTYMGDISAKSVLAMHAELVAALEAEKRKNAGLEEEVTGWRGLWGDYNSLEDAKAALAEPKGEGK